MRDGDSSTPLGESGSLQSLQEATSATEFDQVTEAFEVTTRRDVVRSIMRCSTKEISNAEGLRRFSTSTCSRRPMRSIPTPRNRGSALQPIWARATARLFATELEQIFFPAIFSLTLSVGHKLTISCLVGHEPKTKKRARSFNWLPNARREARTLYRFA